MAPPPAKKQKKTNANVGGAPSSGVNHKVADSSPSAAMHGPPVRLDLKVQQAKKFAVAQAQQEGCLGNYRSFDSPFGNYLVPVIPTQSDLLG